MSLLMASELAESLQRQVKKYGDMPIIIEYTDSDKNIHLCPITCIGIGHFSTSEERTFTICNDVSEPEPTSNYIIERQLIIDDKPKF